jgi:hypothetical protein
LKEQEQADDPMLKYVRCKRKEQEEEVRMQNPDVIGKC